MGYHSKGLLMSMTKKCAKCGRELSVFAFGSRKGTKDGLSFICEKCMHDVHSASHKGGKPKKESNVSDLTVKEMETKTCTRCGREFPLESFPTSKKAKDGHISVCKECNSKARSEARPKKKTVHVEGVALFPASTDPAAHPDIMGAIADKALVEELRKRGWEVTCKRIITEEL